MTLNINGLNINYEQYGKKESSDIVLLHGWGQNIEMMNPIGQFLKDSFYITLIDLPGFGKSDEPNKECSLYDYVNILNNLFIKLKIKNPILIGHSFGGKISIVYSSLYKTKKLVLFGSPYKKTNQEEGIKLKILRSFKKVPIIKNLESFAKKHIGSTDYKQASPIMREILVHTINEDVTNCLKKIKCQTLLIWGDKDSEVPIEDAKIMEDIIEDAALIIYPNCTHYAYLENIDQTNTILNNFFKDDEK